MIYMLCATTARGGGVNEKQSARTMAATEDPAERPRLANSFGGASRDGIPEKQKCMTRGDLRLCAQKAVVRCSCCVLRCGPAAVLPVPVRERSRRVASDRVKLFSEGRPLETKQERRRGEERLAVGVRSL